MRGILKPASYAPLSSIRLAELALEAGFLPGIVNVVTGPGGTAGAVLAGHEGVGKVAFTGETTTGQEIMRLAGNNLKRVSLELGGKSPNICFADADLEKFATEAPLAVFGNAGQDCRARSRILVERSVHDRVVELLVQEAGKLVIGDPAEDKTQVGSLIGPRQLERVEDYLAAGRSEGATVALGGNRPAGLPHSLANGAFVAPTIFDGVKPEMRIWREEIFGPVAAVVAFNFGGRGNQPGQ